MAGTRVWDVVRGAGALPVVLGLLVLVTIAAAMSGPRVTQVPLPTAPRAVTTPDAEELPTGMERPTMPPETSAETGDYSGLATGMLVFGVLVALFIVVTLVLYLRRRGFGFGSRSARARPESDESAVPEAEDETVDPEIREAVEAGIDQLDDESDPRRAVIGCWLRLESAARRAGIERRPDDTAAELVSRMLSARSISAESLTRLAELYRRARYGPDVVDEGMRVEARSTLAALRTELTEAAPNTPVPAAPSPDASTDASTEQAR